MTPLTLPNELYDRILKELPIEDLASVSLLNHAWQADVFPHLYEAPCLCFEKHLKQFAERLEADDACGPLSVVAHMKGLLIYRDSGNKEINQESLECLKAIIMRLPNLKRLSWGVGLLANHLDILPFFQRQCAFSDLHDIDQRKALLNLTGLAHLSIQQETSFEKDQVAFLSSMLSACPNLVSLKLKSSSKAPPFVLPEFSADALVNSLGNEFTFPSLRTFHLRGNFQFNWHSFLAYSSSSDSPLGSFLTRHPGIQDLVLESDDGLPYGVEVQLNLSQLLPSLKHFEGPSFFCRPLLCSSLAGQLETIRFLHERHTNGTGLWKITSGANPLPRLRQLTILTFSNSGRPVVLNVFGLKISLQASTMLEKLETDADLSTYPLFIELLKQLPDLREIGLNNSVLFQARTHTNDGKSLEWKEFIPILARTCPRLETVRAAIERTGWTVWNISRSTHGGISVKQVDEPKRKLGRWED